MRRRAHRGRSIEFFSSFVFLTSARLCPALDRAAADSRAFRRTQAIPKGVNKGGDEFFVGYFQGVFSEGKTREHTEEARAEQRGRNMRGRQAGMNRAARLLRLDEAAHGHVKALRAAVVLAHRFAMAARKLRIGQNSHCSRRDLLKKPDHVQSKTLEPLAGGSSGDGH